MDNDERSAQEIAALDDAFQLLANETRLEILRALWAAPLWTATYSELKDAVGMRDSGRHKRSPVRGSLGLFRGCYPRTIAPRTVRLAART